MLQPTRNTLPRRSRDKTIFFFLAKQKEEYIRKNATIFFVSLHFISLMVYYYRLYWRNESAWAKAKSSKIFSRRNKREILIINLICGKRNNNNEPSVHMHEMFYTSKRTFARLKSNFADKRLQMHSFAHINAPSRTHRCTF